jgi:hypothetical protein
MCHKAGPMNSCTTTKSHVSQYTRLHSYCVRHKDNSISRGLPCREYQNRWPKMKVCNIVKYMAIGCLITKKRHHAEYVIWSTKKGLHGKAKGFETFEIRPTKNIISSFTSKVQCEYKTRCKIFLPHYSLPLDVLFHLLVHGVSAVCTFLMPVQEIYFQVSAFASYSITAYFKIVAKNLEVMIPLSTKSSCNFMLSYSLDQCHLLPKPLKSLP